MLYNNMNTRNKLFYPVIFFALIFSYSSNAQNNNPRNNNATEPEKVSDIRLQAAAKDDQTAKNYVLNVEKLVNLFEKAYQSARVSSVDTKPDELTKMNVVYEEFTGLKYSPDNPMVLEVKRLVGSFMEKRMNYISRLIMKRVNENEDDYSRWALLGEGNGVYTTLLDRMNKVKSYYSM
jgi:hypothetical protein